MGNYNKESIHKEKQYALTRHQLGNDLAKAITMYFSDQWQDETRKKIEANQEYSDNMREKEIRFTSDQYRVRISEKDYIEHVTKKMEEARDKGVIQQDEIDHTIEGIRKQYENPNFSPKPLSPDNMGSGLYSVIKNNTEFYHKVRAREPIEGAVKGINEDTLLTDSSKLIAQLTKKGTNAKTLTEMFKPYGFNLAMIEDHVDSFIINPGSKENIIDFKSLIEEEKKNNPEEYQKMQELNQNNQQILEREGKATDTKMPTSGKYEKPNTNPDGKENLDNDKAENDGKYANHVKGKNQQAQPQIIQQQASNVLDTLFHQAGRAGKSIYNGAKGVLPGSDTASEFLATRASDNNTSSNSDFTDTYSKFFNKKNLKNITKTLSKGGQGAAKGFIDELNNLNADINKRINDKKNPPSKEDKTKLEDLKKVVDQFIRFIGNIFKVNKANTM